MNPGSSSSGAHPTHELIDEAHVFDNATVEGILAARRELLAGRAKSIAAWGVKVTPEIFAQLEAGVER